MKNRALLPLSSFPTSSTKTYRIYIAYIGDGAFIVALCLMATSLIIPQDSSSIFNEYNSKSIESPHTGMGMYLIIDKSGSMNEAAPTSQPLSKIAWAKQIAEHLIQSRPQDTLGLISFARAATIVCPLTLAHHELLTRLESITPVTDDNQNGTAIGYALFKTANLMIATSYFAEREKAIRTPTYTTVKKTIILLTDGLQSPHPADKTNPYRFIPLEDALAFCQENNIQVFYIAVDPVLKSKEFALETHKTEQAVEKTGGFFYILDDNSALQSLDAKLSHTSLLHSSRADKPQENPQNNALSTGMPVHKAAISLAMIFLFFGFLVETVFARSGP